MTHSLIGQSPAMQQVRAWVHRVSEHPAPVLLTGETGTGKDVVARALADHAARPGSYIPINCGALGQHLIESELFGHERGSFTGAHTRKIGAFEAAHRGTLFLDEIGELPMPLQAQFLRVLESGEVRPVGAHRHLQVHVRVIAATNRNLAREVEYGTFRNDLFHRLHVLVLELPALRHRLEDLPALAAHFLLQDALHGMPAAHLGRGAMEKLMSHLWPGNVRELRNVLQRATYMARVVGVLDADSITFADHYPASNQAPLTLRAIEREAIVTALKRCRGNRKAAAESLGLSRSTLHRRLNELGLAAEHPALQHYHG